LFGEVLVIIFAQGADGGEVLAGNEVDYCNSVLEGSGRSGFAELDSSGELGVVRSSVENSEVDGAGLIIVSVAFGLAGGSAVGSPSGGLEMG